MNRMTLPAAMLLAASLTACSQDPGHDHHGEAQDHHHGEADDHHHGSEPAASEASAPAPAAADATSPSPGGPVAFQVGPWSATLHPSPDALRLTVQGSEGAAAPAGAEARVVLTGVGEEEQRLTLQAGDGGWSAPARAAGAPGYTAVVSLVVEGRTESGRATWGQVPAPKEHDAGEAGHSHGESGNDHGESGHDHDHGEHGHAH